MKKLILILILPFTMGMSPGFIGNLSQPQISVGECVGFAVCQNFEGAGYDNSETWTESGSGTKDEDYATAPAPLRGTQSYLQTGSSTASTSITLAAEAGEAWGHFEFYTSDGQPAAETYLLRLMNSSAESIASIRLLTTGYLKVLAGTSGENSVTTQLADGPITPFRIWWYYKSGTGANAVFTLWISDLATLTRPETAEVTETAGTGTTDIASINTLNNQNTMSVILDQILVKTSAFTTVSE